MKAAIALALLLCACASRTVDGGPADQATRVADLATAASAADLATAAPDLAGGAHGPCSPKCAQCDGVCCGAGCCAGGEWCDAVSASCRCGDGPACGNHAICVAFTDGCGTSCQPILR
jgi:hypothetical protein